MEATAVCVTLLTHVLLLLLPAQVEDSCSHSADASVLRILPSRLQFFEYESVFVNCEGFLFRESTQWRVMRRIKNTSTLCYTNWETKGPCTITTAFSTDSGEYWCEAGGKTSNTVRIVVSAGSVTLESPVSPVTEGDDVTLRCRNKMVSNYPADFYKDGRFIRSSSTGNMTISSVSRSDEGLYRCNITGAGESAESWLAVRVILESPARPVTEGETVTLRCRGKMASNYPADFYKDGRLIESSYTGNMTISSVSRSDEGLYKCNITGGGESAESWLAVRAFQEETRLPASYFHGASSLLWMAVTLLLVALLLLLTLGLHYMKLRAQADASPSPPSSPELSVVRAVSAETRAADRHEPEYAITHPREAEDHSDPSTTPVYYALSMGGPAVSSSAVTPAPSASTSPPSED